ncbi:MAG: two-component system, NtrC family, response regulator HydG [Desulfovibrionales bacterium]|nr:two-component system, NtrC family, response regulator HydG [Desulfovibrionales bacterium]
MTQEAPFVLLVDDEPEFLSTLAERIRLKGFDPITAASGREALVQARTHRVELAIVDQKMPDMDGLVTITKLKELRPGMRTVLLTGHGGDKIHQASEALDSAYFEKQDMRSFWDFLRRIKSESGVIILSPPSEADDNGRLDELEAMAASRSFERSRIREERSVQSESGPKLIGETNVMQELKETISKVGALDCTVLLRGETGSGKELVAKLIHRASPRANNRFFAVNCASLSHELLSNELFGHEKEAFTGAQHTKKGIFEATHGGTILLDEIGDTPKAMQVQLLRVLQEKTIIRVGGSEEIPVDVRVIAATNQSLKSKLEDLSFREDLYYRLNAFTLRIPPLRERREDIPALCSYFLQKYNRDFDKRVEQFDAEVMDLLQRYPFPGNVRELENVVERAVILCEGRTVRKRHLPERFRTGRIPARQERNRTGFVTLAELETQYIQEVLEATHGNKSEAAKVLGINRASLWRKLKRLEEDQD